MANNKATNMLAAGSNAAKAAPQQPAAPLPRVAVASYLAAAAAAVEDFIARVHLYFDRVEGGFESPPPFVDGAVSSRCSAAWETPDCLGRAMQAITDLLFVVNAYEVESGPIRRGMDGAWLNPHSKWSSDEPWSALCIEVIDAGRGIAEKKAEVQRGFERESLTFKWASDATMAWADGMAKRLRVKHAEILDDNRQPHLARVVQVDGQPFFVREVHMKILHELVAAKRAVVAVELHTKIGSGVEHTRDVCREMEATVPPLIMRAGRNSGFAVTNTGVLVWRERSERGTTP